MTNENVPSPPGLVPGGHAWGHALDGHWPGTSLPSGPVLRPRPRRPGSQRPRPAGLPPLPKPIYCCH